MSTTSEQPDPSHVVQQPSRTPTPPSVLSQEDYEHEQLLKFFIGLRLLGEVKAKRLLSYIQVLQQEQEQEQKEKANEF